MKIWILLFIILAVIYDYRDFQIPNWLYYFDSGWNLRNEGDGYYSRCVDRICQLWIIILYWMPWRWRRETAYGMRNFYRVGNAPVSNFIIYM